MKQRSDINILHISTVSYGQTSAYNAIRDAIALAAEEGQDVIVEHGNRKYRVNISQLIKLVMDQDEPSGASQ